MSLVTFLLITLFFNFIVCFFLLFFLSFYSLKTKRCFPCAFQWLLSLPLSLKEGREKSPFFFCILQLFSFAFCFPAFFLKIKLKEFFSSCIKNKEDSYYFLVHMYTQQFHRPADLLLMMVYVCELLQMTVPIDFGMCYCPAGNFQLKIYSIKTLSLQVPFATLAPQTLERAHGWAQNCGHPKARTMAVSRVIVTSPASLTMAFWCDPARLLCGESMEPSCQERPLQHPVIQVATVAPQEKGSWSPPMGSSRRDGEMCKIYSEGQFYEAVFVIRDLYLAEWFLPWSNRKSTSLENPNHNR